MPPIDYSLIDNYVDNDQPSTSDAASANEQFRHERFVIESRNRQVLVLPYVDVGLPDFIEYEYADADRYLADENFVYGRRRDEGGGSILFAASHRTNTPPP